MRRQILPLSLCLTLAGAIPAFCCAADEPAVPAQTADSAPHGKYYRAPGIIDIQVTPMPPGIVREVDVPVVMRDGRKLYVNVYRPQGAGPSPVVLAATRYGKDKFGPGAYEAWAKASGYEIGRMTISEFTPFEAPDPAILGAPRLRRGACRRAWCVQVRG